MRLVSLWAPVVAYAAGIFWLSATPQPPALPAGVSDKAGHALLFAGFALVLVRACAGGRCAGVTAGRTALAVLLSIAYGLTDEWHQGFVPTRVSDMADLGADAMGALAAGVVAFAMARMHTARSGDRI
jgi:VanZ family protein